jgi:hypothetical protein
MANVNGNSVYSSFSNQHQRQLRLISLISELCAPRRGIPEPDMCRLVVDSRLPWAFEPIDGNSSWLYLPKAVRARNVAGVMVLSAE